MRLPGDRVRFDPTGDIFLRGRLIGTDEEIVEGMHEFVERAHVEHMPDGGLVVDGRMVEKGGNDAPRSE
jgi:hypothetical protein